VIEPTPEQIEFLIRETESHAKPSLEALRMAYRMGYRQAEEDTQLSLHNSGMREAADAIKPRRET
jgi:hypothetical protein